MLSYGLVQKAGGIRAFGYFEPLQGIEYKQNQKISIKKALSS